MACGDSHSMVLDSQGNVYTWGSNEFGQLGSEVSIGGKHYKPTKISKSKFNGDVKYIWAEGFMSFARTVSGKIYAFG